MSMDTAAIQIDPETEAFLAAQAKMVYRKRAEIKRLEEEVKEITSQFENYEERDWPAGDYILRTGKTRRFDPVTAKRKLTAEEYEAILVLKADSAKAKKVLDEDVYEECQKEFGTTIRVFRLDEKE